MNKELPMPGGSTMARARKSCVHLAAVLIAPSLIVLAGLPGCDPPEPATPQTETMHPVTRALKIFPRLEGNESRPAVNAFTACRVELSRLGYTTVNSLEKADVIARFDTTITEEASMLNVTVNGRRKVSYKVTSRVTVESLDGSTIFLGSGSYSSDDDDGSATMAKALIGRLHLSGKLSAYANQLQREHKDAELKARQRRAREEAAKEAEEKKLEEERKRKEDEVKQKEEALWQASNAQGCSQPLSNTACDGVKKYIEAYPSGRFTAQARQALQEGEAKILLLEIEQDWKSLDLGRCKNPKTTGDCTRLQAHLARYPGSPHAEEARTILNKVDAKLQFLAKQEKQKADAEAAVEEARRKREAAAEEAKEKAEAFKACQEQCRDACIDWRTGGTRAPCMNRCVARDCR